MSLYLMKLPSIIESTGEVFFMAKSKHAITLLLLILAILFYALGLALPATLLIVFGVLLEGAFWIRLFRGVRHKDGA
jgi:cytochrome c biogenesis protein CcdA